MPIDVAIVNLPATDCIEVPSARSSINYKKDVVIDLVCRFALDVGNHRAKQRPANVRMTLVERSARDNGVVIDFSWQCVLYWISLVSRVAYMR